MKNKKAIQKITLVPSKDINRWFSWHNDDYDLVSLFFIFRSSIITHKKIPYRRFRYKIHENNKHLEDASSLKSMKKRRLIWIWHWLHWFFCTSIKNFPVYLSIYFFLHTYKDWKKVIMLQNTLMIDVGEFNHRNIH